MGSLFHPFRFVILGLVPRIQTPGVRRERSIGKTGSLDPRHKGEDDGVWGEDDGMLEEDAGGRAVAHV